MEFEKSALRNKRNNHQISEGIVLIDKQITHLYNFMHLAKKIPENTMATLLIDSYFKTPKPPKNSRISYV